MTPEIIILTRCAANVNKIVKTLTKSTKYVKYVQVVVFTYVSAFGMMWGAIKSIM